MELDVCSFGKFSFRGVQSVDIDHSRDVLSSIIFPPQSVEAKFAHIQKKLKIYEVNWVSALGRRNKPDELIFTPKTSGKSGNINVSVLATPLRIPWTGSNCSYIWTFPYKLSHGNRSYWAVIYKGATPGLSGYFSKIAVAPQKALGTRSF